jgi:hypothetical protein
MKKNTDINAKFAICFPSGTSMASQKYAKCYLTQHLRQGLSKFKSTLQTNGEKVTEEQKKDYGYES